MLENPYSSPDANNDLPQPPRKPFLTARRLLEWSGVSVVLFVLVLMLLPATRRARPAAHRTQCKNNLKQIMLALHNYQDTYHSFPPAYTIDDKGQPLHSW